jgi:hypothetical protein
MRFRHIWIPIYDWNLWVGRGTRASYRVSILQEFGKESPAKSSTCGATFETYLQQGQWIGVLWFKPNCRERDEVHEVFHAVHYLTKTRGMYLDDASEEAYCYLMAFIWKELKRGKRI